MNRPLIVPSPERDRLRALYVGKRIRLVETDDPHTVLRPGDEGVCDGVDDAGTVSVRWDNGSGLGLIFDEDKFEVLP